MMSAFRLTFILLLCTGMVRSQDYDYVQEDSLPENKKKSSVSLPIKSKESQPVYFVPSYMADQDAEGEEEEDDDVGKKVGKTSVNLEVGASVASDNRGNTALTTYAAPHVKHQVDEKLAVSVGMMMSQSYFDGWTTYSLDGRSYSMPSYINTNMAYARLDYQVSEKLLVFGSVYTNLSTMPGPGYTRNLQGTGYSLGMEYKISEKSFFQIQIHRSTGYNPYIPYNTLGFGSRPISYFP